MEKQVTPLYHIRGKSKNARFQLSLWDDDGQKVFRLEVKRLWGDWKNREIREQSMSLIPESLDVMLFIIQSMMFSKEVIDIIGDINVLNSIKFSTDIDSLVNNK